MTQRRAVHILALGQSNLANHGRHRTASKFGGALHDGNLHPLRDPIPGGSGDGGSIWPRFAQALQRRDEIAEVIISLRAIGGTSIADWSRGGKCYEPLAKELDALRAHPVAPTHVVFHQGERDNLLGTSTDAYRERFAHLHDLVRVALPDAVWIICQASFRAGVMSSAVTDAQRLIAAALPNCRLGPNTDALGDDYRYDGTHLDALGQATFADQLAAYF